MKLKIQFKQTRKFTDTTNSKHTLPVADNLLDQMFTVCGPNEIWVSDITYIPTDEGWLYCTAHKDLFNGEIVGYALGSRITKDLVIKSLLMAVKRKQPEPGLIHHSDRGSQYCSQNYTRLLERFNMKASMSRKGNCYDNAPMESFWGTLKNKLLFIISAVHQQNWQSERSQNILRSLHKTTGTGQAWICIACSLRRRYCQ